MSSSFHERFKGKISVIGKQGEIVVNNETCRISSAKSASLIEETARRVVKNTERNSEVSKPATSQLSNPIRQSEKSETNVSRKHTRSVDFVPYNLSDYESIRHEKYYQLGCRGSDIIGTEEWKIQKQSLNRRNEYARHVNRANFKYPPRPAPIAEPKKELSSREKALQFAKNIKKPPLKPEVKEVVTLLPENPRSVLEELENEHEQYAASIEEIRAKL